MEKRNKIIFGVAISVVVLTTIGLFWATKKRSGGFGKSKIKKKHQRSNDPHHFDQKHHFSCFNCALFL
jgi:FtsZ-interacting cell division protein ZipA